MSRFKVHAGGVIAQLGEWVGLLKDKEALKTSLQESARWGSSLGIYVFIVICGFSGGMVVEALEQNNTKISQVSIKNKLRLSVS